MNLNNRVARLERALAGQHCNCNCPDNTDLSWPGHHPHQHCPSCDGERVIYPLTHHPHDAEPLLRSALPIIAKAYDGDDHADLTKLTDEELQQLKAAVEAAHQFDAPRP